MGYFDVKSISYCIRTARRNIKLSDHLNMDRIFIPPTKRLWLLGVCKSKEVSTMYFVYYQHSLEIIYEILLFNVLSFSGFMDIFFKVTS